MAATPHHAVVLGAGITGLLTARALAEHVDKVTIVEQDPLPDGPVCRRGVPQGAHLHGLVSRGRHIIDGLLPGFTDRLIAHSAPTFDFGADVVLLNPFGWGQRIHSDLYSVAASRALVEWVIRQMVTARPAITLRQRMRAVGLVGTDHRVSAVRVRAAGTATADELPADLVVDATGRGSRSQYWLRELGLPPLPSQTIDPRVGYASRVFRIPDRHHASWKACYLQAMPPWRPRGAALLPIEGDRWIVTLIGIGPNRPNHRENEFLPFARSLPSPIVADALHTAEPLTAVAVSNATSNRRSLFRQRFRQPANLILAGDAACCLNPIYAQGMTTAAMAAALLDNCLSHRHDPSDIARHFQRRFQSFTNSCWTLAATADSRSPHSPPATVRQRITSRYLDRVLIAGTRDPAVQLAFLRVLNMLHTPAALLTPAIATRVLRNGTGIPAAGPGPPPDPPPER